MAKRIRESDFYLDRPKALGWRGLSLLVPACMSAIGFFAFAVMAFGFTEIETLAPGYRTTLVLVGAVSLAAGSEIGTLSAVVEIFRKNEQCKAWDWIGLGISALCTLTAFVLSFAALLGVQATWSEIVKLYGPIILGALSALDAYSGFMEFGLYLNSHDERMQDWRVQFEQFKRAEFELGRMTRTRPVVQDEHERVSTTEGNGQFPAPVEQARSVKAAQDASNKQTRLASMLDIYRTDPATSASSIAQRLDISRSTVYSYVRELEDLGRIRKNGDGIEVLV
jgi:hypothetical protein